MTDFDLTPWLDEHDGIALCYSGGKDSTATLLLLKPWWDFITVYWSNPGAPLPATVELMQRVKRLVPHFVEVRGDVLSDIETFGWPSDLTPHSMTPLGRQTAGTEGIIVRDRAECCVHNLMQPIYERIVREGNTLLIRGQRNDEELQNRASYTGYDDEHGLTHLLPIADWSAELVLGYINAHGPELLHPIYATASSSMDCACCTAYWGDGHTAYLLEHEPEAGANRQQVINEVLYQTDLTKRKAIQ